MSSPRDRCSCRRQVSCLWKRSEIVSCIIHLHECPSWCDTYPTDKSVCYYGRGEWLVLRILTYLYMATATAQTTTCVIMTMASHQPAYFAAVLACFTPRQYDIIITVLKMKDTAETPVYMYEYLNAHQYQLESSHQLIITRQQCRWPMRCAPHRPQQSTGS